MIVTKICDDRIAVRNVFHNPFFLIQIEPSNMIHLVKWILNCLLCNYAKVNNDIKYRSDFLSIERIFNKLFFPKRSAVMLKTSWLWIGFFDFQQSLDNWAELYIIHSIKGTCFYIIFAVRSMQILTAVLFLLQPLRCRLWCI